MENYTPPAHKRAAAFSLSAMLSSSNPRDIQHLIVSWILHDPFFPPKLLHELPTHRDLSDVEAKALELTTKVLPLNAAAAFSTLSKIMAGADPSPAVMAATLGPVVPQLFSLSNYLTKTAIADPTMKELVTNILAIWARAAAKEDITNALMKVIDGEGFDWEIDEASELQVVDKQVNFLLTYILLTQLSCRPKKSLSFTLAELSQIQEDNLDTDANPLHLHPDPTRFTSFLKNINRPEVTFQVFLRILDYQRKMEDDTDADPIR